MFIILCGLTSIILIWCIQYHWKRRQLYQAAKQMPGPYGFPIIGSAHYFIGSIDKILNNIQSIVDTYKSPTPMWLGNELNYIVWDPICLKAILNSPHAINKSKLYKHAKSAFGNGLFMAAGEKWKQNKKILMQTFNQKILNQFVAVFAEKSEVLVEELKKEVGKKFEIFPYLTLSTFNIVCETAMSVSVQTETTDFDFFKCINKIFNITYKRMFNVWLQLDFIFNLTPLAKEFKDLLEKQHAFTSAIIKKQKEDYKELCKETKELPEQLVDEETPNGKTNFLLELIKLSEKNAHFSEDDLCQEVHTFVVGGSETTATTMTFTLMVLGMFPDVQQKVYEEAMDILGPDRSVEPNDISKFKYLEMVIKEVLRLFPVVPILGRKITNTIQLGNITFPADSSILIPIKALHRNPEIWPDPLKFDPNRFLPEEVAKRHHYSWLPFCGGMRYCIGLTYSYMTMKTVLAMLIRRYKFFSEYNKIEDVKLTAELTLRPMDGFKISIELRE